jgi:hypothetical protein
LARMSQTSLMKQTYVKKLQRLEGTNRVAFPRSIRLHHEQDKSAGSRSVNAAATRKALVYSVHTSLGEDETMVQAPDGASSALNTRCRSRTTP